MICWKTLDLWLISMTAHAAAFIVEKVVAHALKNLNGEDGGACGEVINTIVFHSKNSFRKNSSLVFGKPGRG